ncbi:hypothetical protein HR12_23480 [Microbacterium sp. SUBG005]|nr:hypothetical protein HR12_39450 [Microbacterium sp. SUBG005]KEP75772.1 hypothetical protein HR12_23480 [Microbacterium sp. SUBG005]
MGLHKLRLEIEFDIDDEQGLTAASPMLEAGLHAPEFSGFQSALEFAAIMSARAAWDAAGLKPVGVQVLN